MLRRGLLEDELHERWYSAIRAVRMRDQQDDMIRQRVELFHRELVQDRAQLAQKPLVGFRVLVGILLDLLHPFYLCRPRSATHLQRLLLLATGLPPQSAVLRLLVAHGHSPFLAAALAVATRIAATRGWGSSRRTQGTRLCHPQCPLRGRPGLCSLCPPDRHPWLWGKIIAQAQHGPSECQECDHRVGRGLRRRLRAIHAWSNGMTTDARVVCKTCLDDTLPRCDTVGFASLTGAVAAATSKGLAGHVPCECIAKLGPELIDAGIV
mmetsp:Transcript_80554/g.226618  ORF Transcript_80554/g.226618 Transcript_80554/m.226618 type:complete len:266 (+) Transcript_80554:1496-2293(+)